MVGRGVHVCEGIAVREGVGVIGGFGVTTVDGVLVRKILFVGSVVSVVIGLQPANTKENIKMLNVLLFI